ncbi:MAG: cytochrome c maturation protein CcmE [Ilumatobacteraceae bacterium]
MDLTPRTSTDVAEPPAPSKRKRPWPAMIVLALVLVGGGVAVSKFLTSAVDYYCNVDEIGSKSGCEVGRELRIQGTVDKGSISKNNGVTDFTITFNNKSIPVVYQGGQVDLFQECIPVVIHGRVVDGTNGQPQFDGTEIEVKHSNEYEAEHQDRVDPATGKSESAACSQLPA